MDPQVSASFIPKKPLQEVRGGRRGASGLIFLLAFLIFIASLVAAGGAFVYGHYLSLALEGKKASLQKYQEAYDLPTIQTLVRFDSRINEARTVLHNHLAPSSIFSFLASQTLAKVRFNSFAYEVGAADKGPIIHLEGTADSFATVALQSDQLGNNKVLKDVIFSNITIQGDGKVGFTVSATLDPAYILYSNNQNGDQLVPAADTTPSGTSTTTTQ
jgi:hypothetical protein